MITCHFANLYLGTYPEYSYTTLHNTHEILASTLFLMNRFLARCLKWRCNHNWTISSYLRFYTFTLPRHQVISFIERSLYFTEPWQKNFSRTLKQPWKALSSSWKSLIRKFALVRVRMGKSERHWKFNEQALSGNSVYSFYNSLKITKLSLCKCIPVLLFALRVR